MKSWIPAFVLSTGLLTAERPALAQFWAATGAPVDYWSCVASSADGTKLVAVVGQTGHTGEIYTSTNSGVSWTQATNAPLEVWTFVASSADGTKLIAVNRPHGPPGTDTMFISGDSGTTWTQVTDPTLGAYSHFWTSVASSADGTTLVAADGSHIFVSTNSGTAWSQATGPGAGLISVAASADGTRLVAAGTTIYTSNDSGITWSHATNAPGSSWQSVASSADGSRLMAVNNSPGTIYLSADSGVTWTPATNAAMMKWSVAVSSGDGTTLIASTAFNGNATIISTDSGVTWTGTNRLAGFYSECCSADGSQVFGASPSTGIYRLQSGGPPLSISGSGTNVLVSWSVYANFQLQQNLDLTSVNWTDVTNSPTIVNQQNQVTISPTNSQNFFRLRSL